MTTNYIIIIIIMIIMIMKNNQMFHPINVFLHIYAIIITYHIFIMKLTFESHISWCPTLADQMLQLRYLNGTPTSHGFLSDLLTTDTNKMGYIYI